MTEQQRQYVEQAFDAIHEFDLERAAQVDRFEYLGNADALVARRDGAISALKVA